MSIFFYGFWHIVEFYRAEVTCAKACNPESWLTPQKRTCNINLYVCVDLNKIKGTSGNCPIFVKTSFCSTGLWQHCEEKRTRMIKKGKHWLNAVINHYILSDIRPFSKISSATNFSSKQIFTANTISNNSKQH